MAASADPREAGTTVAQPSRGAAAADGGADICVDVLVARAGGLADRPLTYLVPPPLRPFAAVGMRVHVPLGARRVLGFVLAVRPSPSAAEPAVPQPGHDAARMRAVFDFPDDAPLFPAVLLRLAREIADETLSSLRDAVQCLVPPEVFLAPVPPRPRIAVRDAARPLPARPGRRQAAMLALLSECPAGVPVSDLVRAGGGAAFRRLAASGAVSVREMPRSLADGVGSGAAAGLPAGGTDRAAGRPTLLLGDPDARAERIARAVAAAVRAGDRALVVVPEIADVTAFADRLTREAGGSVAALHSGLPPRARRAAWLRARDGEVQVVVGTRSALFTPLPRLGLIVLDDEQSAAYKSDAAPRYHGRDVAFRRARLEDARLMLGSAAPSVETYAAAASGALAVMKAPPRRPAPAVTVVDMRAEERRGHIGYLSRALMQAISRHLRARGRVALLVSRRGYASVLLCRECGAAVRCPSCGVAMAYDRETAAVRCSVCGRAGPAPDLCPRCGGVNLRGVGAGTKRIEEVVHRLFPALRLARLDADTSGRPEVLRDFAAGRLRLIVGTVMVLRALRSAGAQPTLVGVVDADSQLYLADFRAAERTLQRLRAAAQLAAAPVSPGGDLRLSTGPSRTGAAVRPAPEIIVQTRVPDHPVLRAIRTGNDAAFYDAELAARRDLGYPPYARLARVVADGPTPDAAHLLAGRVAAAARAHHLDVLGPAPLRGAGGMHGARAQCVLRAPQTLDAGAWHAALRAALAEAAVPGARLVVDVDPQELV
ncbi:MAG TPA: primosomal protein N' [bacterium]|nr:primosomal protein N' [bacterium]